MKVIAKSLNGYLVEMSSDEIAKAAGYSSDYDGTYRKDVGEYRDKSLIGQEFNVRAAYDYHAAVRTNQDAAKECARRLRALAEMMDGTLPDVLVNPKRDVLETEKTS